MDPFEPGSSEATEPLLPTMATGHCSRAVMEKPLPLVETGSCGKQLLLNKNNLETAMAGEDRCQFHQYFTISFFIQKFFVHLFCIDSLCS